MRVATSSFYTTAEATSTGYIVPRRIVPWDAFAAKQEEIWNDLSTGNFFHSRAQFPSEHQIDYVKSCIKPIRSEFGLQSFERAAVESVVEILFKRAWEDSQLQSNLNLQGAVSFESRTNLEEEARLEASKTPKARRKSRGKGNRADEFLVFKTSDGAQTPVAAIEYKLPYKLSIDQLVTGLSSEIWPERDIINTDGDDFVSTSRRLAAAVITQLFSYMIGKGLQYGYVCTGQAFVFLHIPDDPSVVFFSVCVPSMDVMENDDTRLHRTAVAQVFAFLLQAIRAEPPPEAWHDEAEKLGLWDVEYDDLLAKIPLADRKHNYPLTAPHRPQRWEGFKRSPLRTSSLSRCRQPDLSTKLPADEDSLSPFPNASRADRNVAAAENPGTGKTSRPFCSQQCLLGLALGKDVDRSCPNAEYHGQKHIDRLEFLHLIRAQLAVDRGRDADCMPLHRSGSRGSLFKLRLLSHGYTLVAKGMEGLDLAHLQHENEIYGRLLEIQSIYVPHFLFLGWAGRPLSEYKNRFSNLNMTDAITRILKAIHKLGVLHRDAELRNILYDEHSDTLMVVDFERSVYWEISEADFASELEWAVHMVSKYVSNLKT
ncbi:hypothetical protein T069G_01466 [Trichoderma breve]|uniref:Protein kinase domain-containing protein n=1 Tax=Trichoderma breve TaxID=2034170 RepID=A0A9W9EE57_9HYPO|nr:hypothetical protein T069G_01466 [Trichoderma breve]KAJ4864936.1 hypothetical protein T069G_01466 [Trichoderma breve]